MVSVRKLAAATVLGVATFTGVASYSQNQNKTSEPSRVADKKNEAKVLPFVQPNKGNQALVPGESAITDELLRKYVTFLAHDKHRGRLPGEGILEREVTEYLESIFKEAGVAPILANKKSYRQAFIIDWQDKELPQGASKKKYSLNTKGPRFKGLSRRDKEAVLILAEKAPEKVGWEAIRTHNLVGILQGSDEKLQDKYIVVCAHMDHVGIDRLAKPGEDYIYNGADDNASGTAAVLSNIVALAKAKTEGYTTKRSIIVLLTTAEEMGLLGSKFFVDNSPIPLEKISAMINLDMLGRGGRTTVSVIDTDNNGMPSFFRYEHDKIAKTVGIEKVNHDIESGRFRSDQGPFSQKRIPFLYIFEGLEPNGELHPDYHGVGDEAHKIDYVALQRLSRFAFRHLLNAANWRE